MCQSDSEDLQFRIEVETCFASKKLQEKERRDEEKRSKSKKPQPAPAGEAGYPVPYRISGEPLISLREAYYEQQAKRREQIEADRPAA